MEKFTIQRLTRSNYKLWYKQLETVLEANDVEEMIGKEYGKDVQISKEDKKSQGKCLHFIRSSISDDDQLLIINCKTTKEAIEMLKLSYLKKDNAHNLSKELDRLKWGLE